MAINQVSTEPPFDGGPASQMSLRDYFAGLAFQAILTATIPDFHGNEKDFRDSAAVTAKQSYQLADAMLKARAK